MADDTENPAAPAGNVVPLAAAGRRQQQGRQRQRQRAAGPINWPELNRQGEPLGRSQPNVHAFLQHAGIALRHNAFTVQTLVTRAGAEVPLTEELFRNLWLEADRLGLKATERYFEAVIEDIAYQKAFHPVRDYLKQLPRWDGIERVDTFLHRHLGAENTELIRAFGRKHFTGAVRRIWEPGVKYDYALILQGPQGEGKSSVIAALCPDVSFFTDSLSPGDDQKVTIEQTQGKWLCEFSELNGLGKRDVESVKAMITRQVDRSRLAYGRRSVERPRQFVLWGSVNPRQYLRDQTGNRRFLPVPIGGSIERNAAVAAVTAERDQLWAEACVYEAAGETLFLPQHLLSRAVEAQDEALIVDPWEELLGPDLRDAQGVTIKGAIKKNTVWERLGIPPERRNTALSERLNTVMARLGFPDARRRPPHQPPERCFLHVSISKEEHVTWLDPWLTARKLD